MNLKQLLARVFVETRPWHSIDGWFCERCGVECGYTEDELCACCHTALYEFKTAAVVDGGL